MLIMLYWVVPYTQASKFATRNKFLFRFDNHISADNFVQKIDSARNRPFQAAKMLIKLRILVKNGKF